MKVMKRTAVRVYVVAAIILAAYGVSYLLEAATEPPEVEQPNWSLRDLPFQLGGWRGEDTEMDPLIATATGANVIVNRIYRDESGNAVSMHTATFLDPAGGVFHSPLNCYLASGWKKTDETREPVKVADDLSIVVSVTTWEKSDERIMVVYWYQLGQHLLYQRFDLGTSIRWAMRGRPTWPVLIKVMLQVTMINPQDAKTVALGFARQYAEWLNQPEHRKYLDRWGGI
jgi:EpsI family protein